VLPPSEIHYPDIARDKEAFFDKISCPHLKEKYFPKETVNEHAAGGLTDLMELLRLNKIKTTARLHKDII